MNVYEKEQALELMQMSYKLLFAHTPEIYVRNSLSALREEIRALKEEIAEIKNKR